MIKDIASVKIVVLAITAIIFSACGSSLKVEKEFNKGKNKEIDKIISISPEFEVITSTSLKNPRHFNFYKTLEKNFVDAIGNNAQRFDLKVEIINEAKQLDVNSDYYQSLAPLKQEILHAAYMQEFDGGNKNTKINGIYQCMKKPIISSAYSFLAGEYGTNYFAVQGINVHKKPRAGNYLLVILFPPLGIYNLAHIETDLYYYNIVADVSKGEIVHKELRKVVQPLNKSTLNAMIYDSYKILIK